jgi:hypothetical protein
MICFDYTGQHCTVRSHPKSDSINRVKINYLPKMENSILRGLRQHDVIA